MTPVATPLHHPTFLLFGATGDLAKRMLWPSLYHLYCDGLLPSDLSMIGTSRSAYTHEAFRAEVDAAIRQFGHIKHLGETKLPEFLRQVDYIALDVNKAESYRALAEHRARRGVGDLLCYLSTSPALYTTICANLREAGLVTPATRIILEKPIGHDSRSSREISDAVGSIFAENQVFRIDHYLGKETVQNLLALRFANSLFEPVWNARSIEHVQITVAETVGVEGRWSYYDDAGALRDMVQNHILQLLALVAMEPPSSLEATAVRNEKVKVLQSLRPIDVEHVRDFTVAGQYVAGVANDTRVPGYLEEHGAVVGSRTETYVALRAHVDNWRWKGVPFFLRTGKRLERRRTEIVVQFREVPHNIFAEYAPGILANRLVIRLQPEETITLELMNKEPGLRGVQLRPAALNLSLTEAFGKDRRRIAYERLLLDALHGNSTLFVRRDELEAAWAWVDGVLSSWKQARQPPRTYPAGTWGPVQSERMLEIAGARWID